MEKTIYLNDLYDYYKNLLTKRQQECYEDYYFNNLSLSEIANNLEISRNAVYNQIKTVEKKVLFYEENLKMYERKNKVIKRVENLLDDKVLSSIEDIL